MRPIIIALAMLTAAACSDAQSSLAALKAAGYSNIAITGCAASYVADSCSKPAPSDTKERL